MKPIRGIKWPHPEGPDRNMKPGISDWTGRWPDDGGPLWGGGTC